LAAIVLVPGAARGGKDDARLVNLATTLARVRFTVLVPDLPSLRALRVNSGNTQEVKAAFTWLRSRSELAPDGKAGLGGISYAAGPVVLAALEPEIRDRVRFILAIGGYHDLVRALTFFTTGFFQKDGQWCYLGASEHGKWVFTLSMVDRLSDPHDRQILRTMAERKIADVNADVAELATQLGTEGQSAFAFITNQDPERAPTLLRRLPENVLRDIEALNLARRDLSKLKARLILVHGYDDNLIPYTESVYLARALPRKQVRLSLVRGLFHVDVEPSLPDKVGLLRVVYSLLRERDRVPSFRSPPHRQ
jgi:pimeloyl-ACP methyl ester carboxylesterase